MKFSTYVMAAVDRDSRKNKLEDYIYALYDSKPEIEISKDV